MARSDRTRSRAIDIGVRVWKADVLGLSEVVSLDRFSGHFILAPVNIRQQDLWITIAFDHVSPSHLVNISEPEG